VNHLIIAALSDERLLQNWTVVHFETRMGPLASLTREPTVKQELTNHTITRNEHEKGD